MQHDKVNVIAGAIEGVAQGLGRSVGNKLVPDNRRCSSPASTYSFASRRLTACYACPNLESFGQVGSDRRSPGRFCPHRLPYRRSHAQPAQRYYRCPPGKSAYNSPSHRPSCCHYHNLEIQHGMSRVYITAIFRGQPDRLYVPMVAPLGRWKSISAIPSSGGLGLP